MPINEFLLLVMEAEHRTLRTIWPDCTAEKALLDATFNQGVVNLVNMIREILRNADDGDERP